MSLVTFDHRRNSPRRRSTVVTGLLESTGAQIGRLAGLWSAQISDPLPGCNIRVREIALASRHVLYVLGVMQNSA
jgi:hypothetical protein